MKNGCREVMKNLCKQKINHPRFVQREKILTTFINKNDKDVFWMFSTFKILYKRFKFECY